MKEKKVQNEDDELLFEIDDDALLLNGLWGLSFLLAIFFGWLLIFGTFDNLTNSLKGIFVIVGFIYMLIISIKTIINSMDDDKKILFYKNEIIKMNHNCIINIHKIDEIYKFINTNYNKTRFRLNSLFQKLLIGNILICFILEPRLLILILFVIYIYITMIISQSIFIYIKQKEFKISLKIRTLEIYSDNKIISFVLDGTENDKKIENYFKEYANIDLSEVEQCIVFKSEK